MFHTESLGKPSLGVSDVYPPYGTAEFETLPLEGGQDVVDNKKRMGSSTDKWYGAGNGSSEVGQWRVNATMSISQLRPEKDHESQVRAI